MKRFDLPPGTAACAKARARSRPGAERWKPMPTRSSAATVKSRGPIRRSCLGRLTPPVSRCRRLVRQPGREPPDPFRPHPTIADRFQRPQGNRRLWAAGGGAVGVLVCRFGGRRDVRLHPRRRNRKPDGANRGDQPQSEGHRIGLRTLWIFSDDGACGVGTEPLTGGRTRSRRRRDRRADCLLDRFPQPPRAFF